jgi:hypothetical protein
MVIRSRPEEEDDTTNSMSILVVSLLTTPTKPTGMLGGEQCMPRIQLQVQQLDHKEFDTRFRRPEVDETLDAMGLCLTESIEQRPKTLYQSMISSKMERLSEAGVTNGMYDEGKKTVMLCM